MDKKTDIIKVLERIKKVYTAEGETWKVRAYGKAITELKSLNKPVTSVDDLKGIKGIGKGILEKIQAVFDQGNVNGYQLNGDAKAAEELMKVHGIGQVKAKSLIAQGIKTLAELREHPKHLNEKQRIALKYTEEFELRIPRKEMEKHDAFVHEVVSALDSQLSVQVVGSYRRGLKDSGDIDILVSHPTSEDISGIINELKAKKYLVDDFAVGPKKYLGVCRLKRHKYNRRIDILFMPKNMFAFAQLYFTGSQAFNIAMRNYCLETMKLSLSEYGLKMTDGSLLKESLETEESVFKYLGLKYITPEQREKIKTKEQLLTFKSSG